LRTFPIRVGPVTDRFTRGVTALRSAEVNPKP
jgi:hypothetical protein